MKYLGSRLVWAACRRGGRDVVLRGRGGEWIFAFGLHVVAVGATWCSAERVGPAVVSFGLRVVAVGATWCSAELG